MCSAPASRFLIFEESFGAPCPDGFSDDWKVVPRYWGEGEGFEVVVTVKQWFRIFNERFIIISRQPCNDTAAVAGFAGYVAEFGDVFGTIAGFFEFCWFRFWLSEHFVEFKFRPEFDGFVAHKSFSGAADFDAKS